MVRRRWFFFIVMAGVLCAFFADQHVARLFAKFPYKAAAKTLSHLISPIPNLCIWPLLFLIQFLRKKGWFLCYISLSVWAAYFLTYPIKMLVGRARPYLAMQEGFASFAPLNLSHDFHSLPSGHAVISMALFTALSYIFPRKARLLTAVGALLPLSRVMVNRHFLSDVLIGEAFGYLVATVAIGKLSLSAYRLFGKITGASNEPNPPTR